MDLVVQPCAVPLDIEPVVEISGPESAELEEVKIDRVLGNRPEIRRQRLHAFSVNGGDGARTDQHVEIHWNALGAVAAGDENHSA